MCRALPDYEQFDLIQLDDGYSLMYYAFVDISL